MNIEYKLLSTLEVGNEPYASAIARFSKGLRERLNKHDKENIIPKHALMFVCESEQLMAEIAKELVQLNSKIKLSLNPSEEDIGELAEHVAQFRQDFPNNVCQTTLHDSETYQNAVLLVANSVYGSYLSELNNNPITLVFICTQPLVEQKDLFLGCTSQAMDRLLPAFFTDKKCIITHIKTGQYQPLELKSALNDQRNIYIEFLNTHNTI